MSTFRNPVGPQAPQVYWRRRLLVGLGVVAVLVVIILIIVRPGSGGTPTAQNTTTPPASASASTNASSGTPCVDANLTLVAVTDKASYAAADKPQISMKLTNNGPACTVNFGSTKQVLTITSGSETIWTSTDCQTGAVDAPVVIKTGESKTTPAIAWDRTRSSKSTCSATSATQVTAGGASYHLGVALGDLKSKDTVQFLLN
ncbi:MAG: hypothetical protein JWN80_496 [Microbacteriaceae bacterium]|jgi:hypothetical protein|nr:hypothetical protein [Microbacteriaceae bacterium]